MDIDLNMKWNDYCNTFHTDTLYFTNTAQDKIIKVSEGSGDNLSSEDEKEGYVDYWYAESYDGNGNTGGGIFLLTELIGEQNLTIKETIEFLTENESVFDEVDLENCHLMNVAEGEQLLEHFEEIEYEKLQKMRQSTAGEEQDDLFKHNHFVFDDVPYEKTEYLVTGQGFNDITDNLEKSIKETFLGYKAIKDVDINFENDEQMIFKFIVKEDVLADKELFNEMYVEGTLKELFAETNKDGIYIAKTECLDEPQVSTKEVSMETLSKEPSKGKEKGEER